MGTHMDLICTRRQVNTSRMLYDSSVCVRIKESTTWWAELWTEMGLPGPRPGFPANTVPYLYLLLYLKMIVLTWDSREKIGLRWQKILNSSQCLGQCSQPWVHLWFTWCILEIRFPGLIQKSRAELTHHSNRWFCCQPAWRNTGLG